MPNTTLVKPKKTFDGELSMVLLKSSLGGSNVQLMLRIIDKAVLVYLFWVQV